MSAIQVKNVPPEIHEALRQRASREGMSVGEYVLDVIRRDLAVPSQREWLARLSRRKPVLGADVVRASHDARAEREKALDATRRR